jgi:hypothetical protein
VVPPADVKTPTPQGGALYEEVFHGDDGTVLRPPAKKVMWVGAATPVNAAARPVLDLWYPGWTVRFASIPAVDPLGDYWAAYTDGTTLDSASVTVDTSAENSGSVYSHAAAWSHTVALGGVGATETWTLLVQPSFLGADPSFWNFSAPAAPSDSRTWNYSSHLALSAFSISHAPLPQVLWQAPRWRYWIPVNWHTVGGHWGDLGSVPLKILTPLPAGNTWVDVVDGPA